MSVRRRLAGLGLALPDPPRPAGAYEPWMRAGDLVFVSGQFPLADGVLALRGRLGGELTTAQGRQAARLGALNVLAQLDDALGSLDRLASIVRLDGHIACVPGWNEHPAVLDGASALLHEVLGEAAGHARTAFGHPELPLGAPVELVVVAAGR